MGTSHSTPTRRLCEQILHVTKDDKEYKCLRKSSFEFENLALEGGGAKGISYVGALKALEDLGILKKLKRFAGASVGGYIAMQLAVGASVEEILEAMLADIEHRSFDANGVSLLHNFMNHFGWHTGDRGLVHFREVLKKHTGNPDLTFEELYRKRGIELCLTVTNVSAGEVEYLHPKTTPDLPIAVGVKMTMSIPFLFQPVRLQDQTGDTHLYVDGGVTNNFPVNAFDGWYLSMEPEHSFFHTIGFDDPPFGVFNEKTLGIIVFDAYERECMDNVYFRRYGFSPPVRPDTTLSKKKGLQVDKAINNRMHRGKLVTSSRHVIAMFRKAVEDRRGGISHEEFVATFEATRNDPSAKKHWENILGEKTENIDVEKLFEEMDLNGDNEISFNEFVKFLQKKGIPFRHGIQSAISRQITSPVEYVESIFETILLELRRLCAKERDVERTIGIYTDYIGTTDVKLEIKDKEFLLKQGWLATVSYLKEKIGKSMFPSTLDITYEKFKVKEKQKPPKFSRYFFRKKRKRKERKIPSEVTSQSKHKQVMKDYMRTVDVVDGNGSLFGICF